jgi:hypothetical protein
MDITHGWCPKITSGEATSDFGTTKNQKKSTISGKNLNILHVPMFPIWPFNSFFPVKRYQIDWN